MNFSGTITSDFMKLAPMALNRKVDLVNFAATDFLSLRTSLIDYAKAAYWLEFAAKQGNPEALNRLGEMLENGLGVKQDFQAALRCYKLSAEKNILLLNSTLGSCTSYTAE